MHQLKLPILRHNFREGNGVAHLLAKEVVNHFKPAKCSYLARTSLFVEIELNRNKQGVSSSTKYLPTLVCNSLAALDNGNILRDYVIFCFSNIIPVLLSKKRQYK